MLLTNSSGAVSPAARAIDRIAPVAIPPIAAGRITPRTVRQRSTPSASAPRAGFRDQQQYLLARAGDQRQHHDRQRNRAREAAPCAGDDDQAVDDDPDDDRRQPLEQVEHQLQRSRGARAGPGELGQVEAGEDPDRERDQRPKATITAVPISALAIPPPPSPAGFVVRKSGSAPARRADDRVDDVNEQRHGDDRRRGRRDSTPG